MLCGYFDVIKKRCVVPDVSSTIQAK
jgi:hypothetical protein